MLNILKSQKGVAPIIIILIILGVLTAGGIYYYFSKQKVTTGVAQPIETANWKTYLVEDEGGFKRFEIKYPPDAQIKDYLKMDNITEITFFLREEPYLDKKLYITKVNTSEEKCKIGYAYPDDLNIKDKMNLKLNGINFERATGDRSYGDLKSYNDAYKTFSKKSYYCYNFIFVITSVPLSDMEKNKESEIFNMVISTFKPFSL